MALGLGAGAAGRRLRRARGYRSPSSRLAACAHMARWSLWQPWKTSRRSAGMGAAPGLPLGADHLALRALAGLGLAAPSPPPPHALTVGAVGGLVIGMMTRTARGHTARPLRADRYDTACYALVAPGRAWFACALPLLAPALTLPPVLSRPAVVGRLRPVRHPLLAGAVPAAPRRPARMSMDYSAVKLVHQAAVTLSITGFFVRGAASLSGAQLGALARGEDLPHRSTPSCCCRR